MSEPMLCGACKNVIYIEHRWNGLSYVAQFSDKEGSKATHCPHCGEYLSASHLEDVPQDEDIRIELGISE